MSVLMLMRQRMKAIETIQKITHAMRLISMSSHTRLRNKKGALSQYTQEISNLFSQVYSHAPGWHDPILLPKALGETVHKRSLIIIVGSQKGLCGTFNTSLFSFFERSQVAQETNQQDLITVGKRASDYLAHSKEYTVVKSFNDFTHINFTTVSQQITHHIMHALPHYTSVTVYSNWSKSFFAQLPVDQTLIPLTLPQATLQEDLHEGFEWEQSPEELLSALAQSLLFAHLQDILLTSLTAEQAARFVAMDNSTRNARNLLSDMTLNYNKLRQAKITRELTDLIGSL